MLQSFYCFNSMIFYSMSRYTIKAYHRLPIAKNKKIDNIKRNVQMFSDIEKTFREQQKVSNIST